METKEDFTCSISVDMSAEEAMKKISKVPEWWGVNFSGNAEKQGDKFVIKMGGESFFDFTVTELIPGKRVVWLITDCYMPWYSDKTEWKNTKIIFDLTEKEGVTEITFIHEGLTPDVECYKDCKPGWTHWIQRSLLSYLETGKGDFKQR